MQPAILNIRVWTLDIKILLLETHRKGQYCEIYIIKE